MQKINFAELRRAIPLKAAALHYDLKVGRSDMVCCPFHDDKNPSMKLYADHFFCFGCQEHGDVVDLVAKLFGLSKVDAAKKLMSDFGISPSDSTEPVRARIPYEQTKQFDEDQKECYRVLVDYFKYLEFKCDNPDQISENTLKLTEYISMRDYIGYLCDIFITGSTKERVDTIRAMQPHYEALRNRTFCI